MPDTDTAALAEAIQAGDRRALARAITLVESSRDDHRQSATALLERLMPATGSSIRVGLSGAPGVGKSTFVEALGNHVIDQGHRVAALAIDPTSAVSGGSILGDKTRMETLSRRDEAFIRPSPAGTTLGGIARRSRETLLLCEAAGFDVVLVETVGVGQSETRVADMTDMFVLLLQPGGGDALQGIKRGIVELADLLLVNKADGDFAAAAGRAANDYRGALQLLRPRDPDWPVEVQVCSALEGLGIDAAWDSIVRHQRMLDVGGKLKRRRAGQATQWMWSEVHDSLLTELVAAPGMQDRIALLEQSVADGHVPAPLAARQLIDAWLTRRGS